MMGKLTRTIVRTFAFALALCATTSAWATDYTYSNVDSDSLAVKSDGKFGTTSFSFQLNNPSANAATADFPASGYVQLTKISIGARSDNDYQSVTTATLTNNKTSESYAATVTYSSGNDFTAVAPTSWSRKEVKITFGTDGVLVDTTATYTLTFTATLGYSVVTTVASGTQTGDWKPAMRIYGRTPSGSMEMPSSLIPSSGGMALPSTVTVADATGMAFANDSVTIGNSGIQIALASALNYHTIMMKVENIPAGASRLLGWSVNFGSVASSLDNYLSYTGSKLEQHYYYNGAQGAKTYGAADWTRDASQHWVAISYARNNNESGCSQNAIGARSYIDGTEKVVGTGLNWPSLSTDKILVGGIGLTSADPATGMVVKDVVILSDALTAAQVATVTAALNKGWIANAAGTTLTGSNVELPDSNNRVTGTITVAANGTYSADLTVVNGVETVGPNATAVLNSAGDYSSATTVSGAGVLKGDFTSNNSLAFNGEFTHSGNVMIGACSGNNTATVTIGNDADVTVSHLRFLNSANTTASATLNVYGTLTVDSVSTSANVWSERNNYKGILFGHWQGTGNYNIYTGGSLIGEAAYLQLVYSAGSQTLAVNGGTLKVRGIQANNGNGALTLTNGGRLELAEGFINNNIAQTYGYGTISAYSYSGSKGWTSSQPATFNDTENGTTIDPAGLNITFSGAISGAGKIIVNDSVGGGKVSFTGDLSGFTGSFEAVVGTLRVPSGVTIGSVAGTATVMVPGGAPSDLEAAVSGGYALSGSLNIANLGSIGGSILLVDVNGQEAVNATTSYEGGVFSFSGTAPVNATYTGNQWWWDYEFNGTVTSIGSDTGGMSQEGSATSFTTADASGNQELYFQKTPYRSASFSDKNNLTAVMYCQPGNYANTVLIGFGSTYANNNAIALVTGDHPEQGEMKLVLVQRGSNAECTVTPLANMKAVDATTKKHLYAFVMDRITENATEKTRVRVYLDGKVKSIYKHNGTLSIGDGFQIGSIYGGVKANNNSWDTGLTKYPAAGDSGTLDFLRMKDGSLSSGAMAALANAYPYNSAHGEATRDPISSESSWVATGAWTQVVPNQDDAIQDAPNADTNVKLSVDGSSAVSVALNLTTDSNYESVTFAKEAGATGSLKITSGYGNNTSGKLVAAESSILVDTTIPAGRVNLGIASVADGVTLTVDPYSATGNYAILSILESLPLGGVYEDEIISMALLGEGASVVFDSSALSDLAAAGFTATFVYNESNQSYTFRVERESSADVTVNITALGTTWMAHGVAMPAPETLTLDSANTVTINNSSGSAAEISTAFAGGNVTVSSSGAVELSGAITTSGNLTFNSATTLSGTSTISGAVSGTGTLTVSGTVTLTSTGTIANTVIGDGRVVFVGKLPASNLQTSFKDSSNWSGTVELKNYTHPSNSDYGIIKFNDYGTSSSAIALNGVTSTIFAGNNNYPNVTLRELEIGEGGWTDGSTGNFTISPRYSANLTGHGTITINTGSSGTVQFVGNHTFDGSVAFGNSTGKQVAFMKTASDELPSVTAKAIVVADGVNMSIASGKSWTAPGGIKLDGSLTVLTAEKASATSVTPTAYVAEDPIEEVVDETAGTTTYRPTATVLDGDDLPISDNQSSRGYVTVSGASSISGSGGAFMKTLTVNDGATLTYDPVITPILVKSAPVFNGTGKLKLAARYAGVTCGKFHLVTYPSSASVSGTLHDLVDSTSFNNATYTVTEETVGDYKQLVLKVGAYDNDAKEMTIAQFGDSITEGIWRSGYRGTPNYRIPLMQLLEAYGYKPEAKGYRKVGSTDANGVPADSAYEYHTGISAQRIYTGLTSGSLRAGFMESIEAHLEQVGVTDIITLKIGTNDSIGGETADNMFEGWSNLVWKIVRMRPTSKIVVCAPVKIRSGENNAPGLRTKIAEYVAKTAAEGGFPDGQVTMINGINIVTDDANYYLTDNVHPNWNGHLQLANAWLPAVTNAFEGMTARAAVNYTAQTAASAEMVTELAAYRAGYVKLATFTNFNDKVSVLAELPYTYVNDTYKDMPMRRVAYFVARKTTASPDTRYVWVDMDANATTGTTLAQFGVPTSASVNGVVTNLHIYSNSSAIENVAPTVSGVRGTLMRTEKGVSKTDGISTEQAPTGPYGFDWNDSIYAEGAWGVMNVARIFDGATPTNHRKLLAAQMLFDFNGFNGSRQNALGLGDFAVHGPYNTANGSVDNFNLNWTFTTNKDEMPTMDARALESGVIEIWGKPAWGNIFLVY